MKAYINLILIYFSISCSLNAQTEIVDHEKYNSYEQCIYVDNLDQRLIPEIFNSTYYSKFKESDFKVDTQVVDTIHKKRYIYLYSKKAKDGYFFVNKMIMDRITEFDYDLAQFKISYVYNDKIVSTKDEVNQILKLKEKNLQVSSILPDKESKVISVSIFDK